MGTVPPRPRAAFWTICLFMLGKGKRRAGEGRLMPAVTGRGTSEWKLTLPAGMSRPSRAGEDDRASGSASASGAGGRALRAPGRLGARPRDLVALSRTRRPINPDDLTQSESITLLAPRGGLCGFEAPAAPLYPPRSQAGEAGLANAGAGEQGANWCAGAGAFAPLSWN